MTTKQAVWPLYLLGLIACGNDSNVQPPVPTTIELVDGDGQSGAIGTQLADPLSVKVTDEDGDPVPGIVVTWAVVSGSGAVAPTTASSDVSGIASTQFTLGPETGEQQVRAEVNGLSGSPVVFTATGSSSNTGGVVLSIASGGNNVSDRYS